MPTGSGNSGVVIDVSLSGSKLESQINDIVNMVDKKFGELAKTADNQLSKIEQKLKNLGKNNESSISKNKQEQQSISELGESYDKLARAMQMKAAQNSKRFDVSEIQQYRMRLHELEAEIRRFEQIPLINKDYNKAFAEIRQQLENIGRRRTELESKSSLSTKDANELRYIISEYERLRKIMYDISRAPLQARQDPTAYVERLKNEYIQVKNAINEMGGALVKASQDENRLIQSAERAKSALEQVNRAVGQPFDVKSYVKDLTSTNSELQAMSKFYKEQEKDAKSAAQSTVKAEQQRQAILKQTQQSLENVNSLQQLSSQIKKRYDVSDIQNYRMQLHELESQMKRLELQSTKQGLAKYNQLGQEIDNISQKIAVLRGQQDLLRQSESSDKGRKTALIQEYERISKEIDSLIRKQQELRNQQNAITPDSAQASKLQELRSEYERIQIAIRNMGRALVDEDNAATKAAERQSRALQELIERREQANRTSRSHSGIEIGSIAPATEADIQKRLQLEAQEFNEIERIRQASRERLELEGKLVQATQQRTSNSKVNSTFLSYEQLRQAIAQTLHIQEEEVQLVYATDASYKRLNTMLNQLKTTYSSLNSEQRNGQKGQSIVALIHETERGLQKIKQQMATPLNLSEAMGHPEKTLNDIIYKMQQLSLYRASLNFGDKNQANEIQQINNALERLKKRQEEIMGSNKKLQDSNTWLARSFQYMKNRLAFYFTIGASTQFVKTLIEIRSQYEMTERALGILVDSAERGSQIFNELSDMALKSPFTLIELSNAAKQLTAYDVAAKDVVDTTRRLADMASAVGVNIDRLTYALGQVKAYGYLNARDARMFANAGIPLVKQLADYYTELEGRMVSVGDVYDRIKKKAVGYEDTMNVITKMTDEGGKFFDFQAKMADTLRVQLANLTLAWNNMLNSIGKSNQGLLTFPIKGLKELFLRWKQISATTTDLIIGFGALKVVQLLVAMGFEKMGLKASIATVAGNRLTTAMKALRTSMLSLASNPWTWIFIAISALTELGMHLYRTKQEAEELKAAIEKSADESVKSLRKFKELNKESIADLKAGIIKPEDTTKLWESIKEELENSADSSSTLVSELMKTQDIAERVKKALEYSEKIEEANIALKNLHGELIKIEDDMLWGVFGEGMVNDIKDWVAQLKVIKSISRQSYDTDQSFENEKFYEGQDYLKKEKEALIEIQKVAIQAGDAIESALGEGIKDKIKLNEAVARVKQQIKLAKPEIQGEVADWFDMQLDRAFSIRWAGFYDETTTLWDKLMEELKKDNSSLFNNITEDWLNGTEQMSDAQKKAFTDAANHLKETLPPKFAETLDAMMADLNSRDFRIRVGISFNVSQLDAVQRDFNRRFLGSPGGQINAPLFLSPEAQKDYESRMQKYSRFNRKEGESTLAWQKRLSDEYKNQNDDLLLQQRIVKQTSGDRQKAAQAELETDQEIVSILKEIASYEGLDLSGKNGKEKKNKTNKSRVKEEDLVAKALSQELSVIREMQSAYEKLRKAGVGTTDALQLASSGYDRTLQSINSTLSKYGISPFKAEDFVGSADPHKLLTALQNQLDTLIKSGKVKTASLKDLEMEIKKVTVDAKEYDMKKITDGLNNELGKIKEEYELAVELDANPELGDMFANMFGIDVDDLPRTFGEAYDRANKVAISKLKELKADVDDFDLMSVDLTKFAEKQGIGVDSTPIKDLMSLQKTWRDMFKKNITETEKYLDDYVKKYGNMSDKIAEIEANRLHKIKQLNEAYFTEQMRKMPEYTAKLDAINKGAEREKGGVRFDEFKNSRLYVTMFENLKYVSTATLETIRQNLDKLKSEMGSLKPEQLKQIVQQFEKIDDELRRRNPFSGLIKNYHDYTNATGKAAKQAEKDLVVAQEKYDQQLLQVTALKEELEQKKASGDATKEELDDLRIKISSANTILKVREEELENAIKLNEQYNLMKKTFGEQWQAIGKTAQVVATNLKSLGELRDYLKDAGVDFGDIFDGVVDSLQGVSDGMNQIVSSATSGDVFGVVTGTIKTVFGIGDAIASIFGDGAARTRRINREIENSQEQVRKLNMAYKDLERTVNKAMGSQEIAAQRALITNKKLERDEIERQLRLEKSKRSKDRDEDAIKKYEETLQSLNHEIEDLSDSIVENLLGNNVKSAAEDFVDTWVSAWKSGENTLDAIQGKMDDVIQNLIKKAVASKVVGTLLQPFYNAVDKFASEQSEGGVELTLNELKALSEMANTLGININDALTALFANFESLGIIDRTGANAQLSALQQGIQGITEDTAGALEAYMNGVSQQVYYQSDLLTQIRDILINFGGDVTIATNAQILLQLQQSFQVQMTIQNVLTGVLNASGLAFRVELTN